MFAFLVVAQLALVNPVVIDGDTLRVDDLKYRLVDIDAPETGSTAKCDLERERGRVTSKRARDLVATAKVVAAVPKTHPANGKWPLDKYGRRLARIEIDGRDLGELLVAEGLARRWLKKMPKPNWCRP